MAAPTCTRALRSATRLTWRSLTPRTQPSAVPAPHSTARLAAALNPISLSRPRCLATSARLRAGMMPESSNPAPPSGVEEEQRVATSPTEIDEEEYHRRADEYMDAVNEKAEAMQEANDHVDVEFSAGVLSISVPSAGTYVLNKQPPNKQIWLSSPTSGPKRYDWVVYGEGMHEKEGGGMGDWIYLRDGSSLTDLLRDELKITVDLHGHEESMQQSVDQKE